MPHGTANLRLVALGTTRRCNLKCEHCRARAHSCAASTELTTERILALFDEIALEAKPIIILTGGEPRSASQYQSGFGASGEA